MEENLDGPLIAQWARRAAAGLRERQAEINSLNVFPIPDSDTGSNMAHTMSEAVSSTEASDGTDTSTVTAALASGAVRGARGNSGMVLSQVLRALADTASRGPVDGKAVARMLQQSVEFVKTSIADPVEGTILTVLRAAAEGAQAEKESLSDVVSHALASAEKALEHTPHQLDALAKAGVVDAGGRGFVVILQALQDTLNHAGDTAVRKPEQVHSTEVREESTNASPQAAAAPHADVVGPNHELEIMFMFDYSDQPEALDELRDYLDNAGNSVVIAQAGESLAKVHVHTRRAGAVIEKAFGLARVFDLRLEVLPDTELTQAPIIALAPAGGAAKVFEGAGAIALDLDTMDARDIDDTLAMFGAGPVTVLTNGRRAAGLLDRGHHIAAIETRSLVGGLAALAVHDSSNDFEDDLEEMADAVSAQRCVETTAEKMIPELQSLLQDGGELVTVLWSAPEVTEADIQRVRAWISAEHADVEFHDYRADGMGPAVEIGVE
ncbi:DAK2 domain-containing protein [Corynebacterium urogenitale]